MSDPSDSPPGWAVEHARALLKTGVGVPQIEQRLVARGLSPVVATAVVDRVLDERVGKAAENFLQDRFRKQAEPRQQAEQRIRLHRILSGVVGGVCILLGYWFGGALSAGNVVLTILPPLACIWFADEMISYASASSFSDSLPGTIVRWFGWLALVAIAFYRIVLVLAT